MKWFLLTTSALLVIAGSASAADMRPRTYTKAPPRVPVPIYNWTGFYIGGHIGAAFSTSNNPLFGGSNDAQFLGGVQAGADYQIAANFVGGLEASYSFLAGSNNIIKSLGAITGRIGYATGPTLIYAKGGYAWADTSNTFGFGQAGRDGYTVGGGAEYMFMPSWSAKAEYQYYDFGRVTFATLTPPIVTGSFRNNEHTIKVGINYRFGWDGPVRAAY